MNEQNFNSAQILSGPAQRRNATAETCLYSFIYLKCTLQIFNKLKKCMRRNTIFNGVESALTLHQNKRCNVSMLLRVHIKSEAKNLRFLMAEIDVTWDGNSNINTTRGFVCSTFFPHACEITLIGLGPCPMVDLTKKYERHYCYLSVSCTRKCHGRTGGRRTSE